uniref:Transmembrane protein INAFM2 n=1 Tax=Ascaris lumbricoides TaxID=6252 RepID=A0A9J2P1N2_ASCLU
MIVLAVVALSCSMNNVGHSTTRLRTKQPVYTSDKRAKFTQRENKKWIRFGTVVGYIFFVSLPAVALSIYYIYIWDPGYVTKFPPDRRNLSDVYEPPRQLIARQRRNEQGPNKNSVQIRAEPPDDSELQNSDLTDLLQNDDPSNAGTPYF